MVSINLTINIDAPLTEEEISMRMQSLGELVINKIKEHIREMKLISEDAGGQLLQNWFASYNNGELTIENTQEYMLYLEFGTYGYWQKFGENDFPKTPDPKKKDMSRALREKFPKGMQPFAFIRKVVYNPRTMKNLVQQAFA